MYSSQVNHYICCGVQSLWWWADERSVRRPVNSTPSLDSLRDPASHLGSAQTTYEVHLGSARDQRSSCCIIFCWIPFQIQMLSSQRWWQHHINNVIMKFTNSFFICDCIICMGSLLKSRCLCIYVIIRFNFLNQFTRSISWEVLFLCLYFVCEALFIPTCLLLPIVTIILFTIAVIFAVIISFHTFSLWLIYIIWLVIHFILRFFILLFSFSHWK